MLLNASLEDPFVYRYCVGLYSVDDRDKYRFTDVKGHEVNFVHPCKGLSLNRAVEKFLGTINCATKVVTLDAWSIYPT